MMDQEHDQNTPSINKVQFLQVMQLTASTEMSPGKTNNETISVAVGLNEPSRFQQLSIKVVPHEVLGETPQSTKQDIKTEQESTETNYLVDPVIYPSEIDFSSIDKMIENEKIRSREQRISTEPSTSNIPVNDIYSKSKSLKRPSTSNIPVANIHSKSKSLKRPSTSNIPLDDMHSKSKSLKSPSTSNIVLDDIHSNKSLMKKSTSHITQRRSYTKRTKENEIKACKKMIKNHDKDILFDALLADTEIDAEKLLHEYIEKRRMNKWNKEDIQKEASRMLNINFSNEKTKAAAQMTPLQGVLLSLSNCFGDNFVDTVIETFGGQLEATKVLEVLKSDELKSAILQKFTAMELLDLLRRSGISNISQEILELISTEKIINHIQLRNDLGTSESLLNILLKNFSEIVSEQMNENLENNVDNQSNSDTALINGVINLVKSKASLKSSDCLLNVMLQHGPKILSDKTMKNIKSFLKNKFNASELNDLSHEVISFHLSPKIIQID